MRCIIVNCTAFIFSLALLSCLAINISPKLELEDSSRASPKLIQSHKYKSFVREQKNDQSDNLDNLGVVNVVTSVNKTQSDKPKESIETDITVRIKTNVDLENDNKTVTDNDADVPVIIGTRTVEDKNRNIEPFRGSTLESRSLFKPINVQPSTTNFLRSDSQISNNIEPLNVPRLEPSYHRHYFGENIPQQIWYPKRIDYRKSLVNAPSWNVENEQKPGFRCSCQNHAPAGLQWYPVTRTYRNPAVQINDKLAKLD